MSLEFEIGFIIRLCSSKLSLLIFLDACNLDALTKGIEDFAVCNLDRELQFGRFVLDNFQVGSGLMETREWSGIRE